ncbi:MAG: dTDP-4-dehydro-6-deoxyglucose aminotransferase [Ignavibacteriae bacterium HGW-Ignavibacteriae-4]|nr:MAG: dTDP-4-dehydro-6-deoxyglucose aminotransferase [Ignavibacteriae bacterium HGW-Ignavibacteriae-4]
MKQSVNDLARFGGETEFESLLHVGRPNIGNREYFLSQVNEVLDSKWLTNSGPKVNKFERKLEEYVGVKHAIAITNGTVALELLIRAAGITGEVIIPSFTFVACAHAFQWQEIKPVFCDIDPNTHNLDPAEIEKHITPNTTAIMGVHLWGRPCDIEVLELIAKKHNLKLLFDASHAFACSHNGKMIGNFGIGEVFSFHATKFFNTLEGGAIVTNDDELAARIRLMKNFGFQGYDNVTYIGTNGKMNEISAAMGLTSFDSIDTFIAKNKENYNLYKTEYDRIDGIKIINYNDSEKNNYQYIACEIDEKQFGLSRTELIDLLIKENILARKYFYPGIHRMEPYRSLYPYSSVFLEKTERLADRIISFPTGTAVDSDSIKRITSLVSFIHQNSGGIKNKMKGE